MDEEPVRRVGGCSVSILYVYDDGGRKAAGFKGGAGDCAARAIAIATGLPYRQVYDGLNAIAKTERFRGKRKGKSSNARTGVYVETVHKYLVGELGWRWTPYMHIGSGCTKHVRQDELPTGRMVLNLSRHFAAVIDGTLHDTYDCSREGTRCVYGWWWPPLTDSDYPD